MARENEFDLLNLEGNVVSKDLGNYTSMLYAPSKFGKAQPLDMIIPTPNGDKRFGDLEVGDFVYDRLGNPTKVIGIFPQGILSCYEIEFSDGRKTYCNDEHLWSYVTSRGNLKTKTLREIMQDYIKETYSGGRKITYHKYCIPTNKAVKKKNKDFIIHPYALGVLIGDGCLTCHGLQMSSPEEEVVAKVGNLLKVDYHKSKGDNYTWLFKIGGGNKFIPELNRLGLNNCKSEDKFIPKEYFDGSVEQRLELLKGLMDTDGSIGIEKGISKYHFSTTSRQLKDDFVKLCNSLGYKVTVSNDSRTKYKSGECFVLRVLTDDLIVSSKKHLDRLEKRKGGKCRSEGKLAITKITEVEPKEMMCIMVDNDEQLYLCNDYIVTHNTTFAVDMFGQRGLILGFEIGYKGIKGAMGVPMRKWSDCAKITRQLKDEKVKEKFNVLIIDTMDLMYDCALKHILAINGVDTINKIGFGQGYTQLDNLIRDQLLEWQRLGYGIFFISHSINREEEVMLADGTKETIEKYIPTLNKRCFNVVNKLVDNIFFGNILLDADRKEQRVLFTRETVNYKAGTRFAHLEDRLPLNAEKVKKAIKEALLKEDDSDEEVEVPKMFDENEKTFDEVKDELTNLVMDKFYPTDNMHEVNKIVEKVLGIGCTVNDTTEDQADALEIILVQLQEKAEKLGL